MHIAKLLLMSSLFMTSALPPAQAQTKSFRCKTDLVNLGDDKASALQKCGEPVFKDNFCATPIANHTEPAVVIVPPPAVQHKPLHGNARGTGRGPGSSCVGVDEWTYNPGYGQFMTTLRFEEGRLAEIRYGDRVK